jgi:hypothetical protein
MISVQRIEGIVPGEPDDLFVASTSFEAERCLAATRRLVNYRTRCAVILTLSPATTEEGERRKAEALGTMLSILSRCDLSGSPRILKVGRYDFPTLHDKISETLRRRQIGPGPLRITCDISCLTKVHLAFLIRQCRREWSDSNVRMLYTRPRNYNRKGSKFTRLSRGVFKPVPFPFIEEKKMENVEPRRLAIVLLGHEGQRTLSAWRRIDAEDTALFFPNSDDAKLRQKCESENGFLLGLARTRPGPFRVYPVEVELAAARHRARLVLDQLTPAKRTRVSIVPFGPKPILIGVLLALLERGNLPAELMYSVPQSYNVEYSSGVHDVYMFNMRDLHEEDRSMMAIF